MTVLEVPTTAAVKAYKERVVLDGVEYSLNFRINTRLDAWFVDVRDVDENIIIPPRRCIVDQSLLEQFRYLPNGPGGRLYMFDTTERHIDPTPDDLGTRVLALYIEAPG